MPLTTMMRCNHRVGCMVWFCKERFRILMTKIFMSLVDLYQFLPARWGGNPEWAGSWAGQQIFGDLCSSWILDPAGLRDSRPIGTLAYVTRPHEWRYKMQAGKKIWKNRLCAFYEWRGVLISRKSFRGDGNKFLTCTFSCYLYLRSTVSLS